VTKLLVTQVAKRLSMHLFMGGDYVIRKDRDLPRMLLPRTLRVATSPRTSADCGRRQECSTQPLRTARSRRYVVDSGKVMLMGSDVLAPYGVHFMMEGECFGDKSTAMIVAGHYPRPSWYNARTTQITRILILDASQLIEIITGPGFELFHKYIKRYGIWASFKVRGPGGGRCMMKVNHTQVNFARAMQSGLLESIADSFLEEGEGQVFTDHGTALDLATWGANATPKEPVDAVAAPGEAAGSDATDAPASSEAPDGTSHAPGVVSDARSAAHNASGGASHVPGVVDDARAGADSSNAEMSLGALHADAEAAARAVPGVADNSALKLVHDRMARIETHLEALVCAARQPTLWPPPSSPIHQQAFSDIMPTPPPSEAAVVQAPTSPPSEPAVVEAAAAPSDEGDLDGARWS